MVSNFFAGPAPSNLCRAIMGFQTVFPCSGGPENSCKFKASGPEVNTMDCVFSSGPVRVRHRIASSDYCCESHWRTEVSAGLPKGVKSVARRWGVFGAEWHFHQRIPWHQAFPWSARNTTS